MDIDWKATRRLQQQQIREACRRERAQQEALNSWVAGHPHGVSLGSQRELMLDVIILRDEVNRQNRCLDELEPAVLKYEGILRDILVMLYENKHAEAEDKIPDDQMICGIKRFILSAAPEIERIAQDLFRDIYGAPRQPIPPKQRFAILKQYDFRCVYCGRSPKDDGITLEVDHVVPRARGGADGESNYVAACRDCNRGKGTTEIMVWPYTYEQNNEETPWPEHG